MFTPSQTIPNMNISKDNPVNAVGYIRVSTEKQAAGDVDLKKQEECVRNACARRGMTLLGIFDDIGSGADSLGITRREGLEVAADYALKERAVLVIPEPTRLFRNVEAAENFLDTYDIPIFSVRHGRFLKRRALLNEIARGEAAVQNIRQGTSEALARKKTEGVAFSSDPVRKKAAQASAVKRGEKASKIVLDIVRILEADPSARKFSHEALADLLNNHGIRTGQRRLWNKDTVRRARKAAEAIILEREEIANDDTIGIPLDDQGREIIDAAVQATATVPAEEPMSEEDAELAELRKLPTFGMFS